MTIVNAHVRAHQITVCTDTRADFFLSDEDGISDRIRRGNVSKTITVPHMPAVIAARGYRLLPTIISGFALSAPDFDALIEGFDDCMQESTRPLADAHPNLRPQLDAECEVMLAGWSIKAKRLRAFYAHKPAGGHFTLNEVYAQIFAPPPYANGKLPPEPQCTEDYVGVARLQAERMYRESDGAYGGDLVIATLTRDGIGIEVVRGFA